MTIDIARLTRLRHSAESAANVGGKAGLDAKAVADTYDRIRALVLTTIPDGMHEEFELLFPLLNQQSIRADWNPIDATQAVDRARHISSR